jgi:hypothetical protein
MKVSLLWAQLTAGIDSAVAMIEDSTKEFLMVLIGEGSFNHPSPRRRSTGASLAPATTTPCKENAPATQATLMFPPWMAVPRPETIFPFERHHAQHEG